MPADPPRWTAVHCGGRERRSTSPERTACAARWGSLCCAAPSRMSDASSSAVTSSLASRAARCAGGSSLARRSVCATSRAHCAVVSSAPTLSALGLACLRVFRIFFRCRLPLQVQLPGEVLVSARTPQRIISVVSPCSTPPSTCHVTMRYGILLHRARCRRGGAAVRQAGRGGGRFGLL